MIERRNYGRGHGYKLDGVKAPGVTSICDVVPKGGLINWAARATTDYAIDYWTAPVPDTMLPEGWEGTRGTSLTDMPISDRRDLLMASRNLDKDRAARRGTEVHRLAQRFQDGEDVVAPPELAGHLDAYLDFLDRFSVEAHAVELVVANRTVGYCGTLDLIADLAGERWLLDLKTSRSGVWGETALQLCAYQHAEVYASGLVADGEAPMTDWKIQRAGAVWIRSDGFDLVPVDTGDDVWAFFRTLAWLYARMERGDRGALLLPREWVGATIHPEPRASAI
jgi:hypothetical protein